MTLIPIRFDEFDISTPTIAGLPKWFVGYDQATNKNVRFNFSSLSAFLTSNMNILILARASSNYLEASGAGAGLHPSFRAAGLNTNINLQLGGKGTGRVVMLSDLDLAGLTLYTNNGDIITGGGDITTGGGDITTGGGDINAQAGNILTSGNVVISGTAGLLITGVGSIQMPNLIIENNGNVSSGGTSISFPNATAQFHKVETTNSETTNLTATNLTATNLTATNLTATSIQAARSVLQNTEVGVMGFSNNFNLTAVPGGSQGDGGIVAIVSRYTTVASAGDAATLPFVPAGPYLINPIGRFYIVINESDNYMNIFPQNFSRIDNLPANAPYQLGAKSSVLFWQSGPLNLIPTTSNLWTAMPLGNGLNGSASVRTMTSSGTIGLTDSTLLLNHGTSLDATLPTAVGIGGKIYTVKNIGTDANLLPDGSETIDGAASVDLDAPNKGVTVQSDGANWQIINKLNF